MLVSMIAGYTLAFIGVGMFVHGWREVYRGAQGGPPGDRPPLSLRYRFARHPQYAGRFIALFGEGVVHWPTMFSVARVPLIVFAYYLLARKEERDMIAPFGDCYRAYRDSVPMFAPRWGRWRELARASQHGSQ